MTRLMRQLMRLELSTRLSSWHGELVRWWIHAFVDIHKKQAVWGIRNPRKSMDLLWIFENEILTKTTNPRSTPLKGWIMDFDGRTFVRLMRCDRCWVAEKLYRVKVGIGSYLRE